MARNNLPSDLIEAILWRLPAKSLCRFKSVSKAWCSLISDPQFIENQLHLNNHKLILVSDTGCLYSVDITKIRDNRITKFRDNRSLTGDEVIFRPFSTQWDQILGSCNGLVLAIDKYKALYLMNPTIREVVELPFWSFQFGNPRDMWGFGYDSSIDSYKVILINLLRSKNDYNRDPHSINTLVTVFDLKNNSVRQLHSLPYHLGYNVPRGVLINGNLHWLIQTRPDYTSRIIAFSLSNEEFTEIEFPNSFDNNKEDEIEVEFEKRADVYNQVVGIGGKLGVFSNSNDLWVMEEYGVWKSWTKISIHGVESIPVCSVDGNIRDIVFGDYDEVGIYNVHERVCRDVRIRGCPNGFNIGGTYVESLVSPSKHHGLCIW